MNGAQTARMQNTKVRFIEHSGTVLSVLEIHTALQSIAVGSRLSQLLFDMRVQVVRREARKTLGARVERLWLAEFDGALVSTRRQLELQTAVLDALDVIGRAESPQALQPHELETLYVTPSGIRSHHA